MTFKLTDRYPGRVNGVSGQYVRGSFKNRSAPNSADGTYLEADWKNDERGFGDRILKVAGVTPNGRVDNADDSQIYDALISIISGMINGAGVPAWGTAYGSENAMRVNVPNIMALTNGIACYVRTQYRNTSGSPTINVNGLGEKAIVKGHNLSLLPGDISGAGFVMHIVFDDNWDRWILLNPAYGVSQPESIPVGAICYFGRGGEIAGWLKMDNSEHQRSQYPKLIAECPQMIRPGSTSSTFRLVDARGYFLRTLDDGRGIDSGRSIGTDQTDCIRNITGKFASYDRPGGGAVGASGAFYVNGNYNANTKSAGDDDWGKWFYFDASRQVPTGNEVRPKNLAFPLYIKV